jgi:hypothetical protein
MGVMRHVQAVVLALAAGVVGCCFTGRSGRDVSMTQVARPPTDTPSGEIVYLDVALIEQPFGDRFVNRDLWDLGDEQGINLELKPVLEENGLRVCQLGDMLPARLQTLLASARSCPDPRRLRAEPGKPTLLLIGRPRNRCAFQLAGDAGRRQVALEQAQCLLEVVPVLEDEQRVRLCFTPHLRHGKERITPRVEKDPDGPLRWAMEARAPVEEFPALRWECTIGPKEFIVLGGQPERANSLGRSFFVPEGESTPTQWLLVLRASRVQLGLPADESLRQAPPIAMQAAWPAARGSSR